MNDTTTESADLAGTEEPVVTNPVETKKPSRFSNAKTRFKQFAKTRKGKAILLLVVLILVGAVSGIVFLIKRNQSVSDEPQIVISETIASDKIYDNYDFIYNSEDDKLIASTADRVKQLEIVSGEEKIVDYIISPDKRKILYSLSDKEYKSKIISTNADLTKFNFSPVAFSIYELNLETGENKKVWSVDKYEVGATVQQIYNQKVVIYPDSYAVGYHWIDGSPFSYPVSNVQVENDIAAGYNTTYLPYDLSDTLSKKAIKLYSYNSDSDKLLFKVEGKVMMYNLADGTSQDLIFPGDITNNCYSYTGSWVGNIVVMELSCNYNYSERRFYLNGTTLVEIDNQMNLGGPLRAIVTKPEYTLAVMRSEKYPQDFNPSLNVLNFNPRSIRNVTDLVENEEYVTVETLGSTIDIVASRMPVKETATYYWTEATYTFLQYNRESNTLEKLQEMVLPFDIYNIAYNVPNNSLSYYRTYRASTESIIEYRILDLATKEDKELLTIKVDNDSVLNYKPKLVWFDIQ
jgi:hypothetical protein